MASQPLRKEEDVYTDEKNEKQQTLKTPTAKKLKLNTEDWWAVWLGFGIILLILISFLPRPTLPSRWGNDGSFNIFSSIPISNLPGIMITGVITLLIF